MKRLLSLLFVALVSFTISCKDRDPGLRFIEDNGLSLYWHHEAGAGIGRHLLLSFMAVTQKRDKYDFKFNYEINGREIVVRLVETVSMGKCPTFPGPDGDLCSSWGNIQIPENELSEGQYKLTLVVDKRTVSSILNVTPEKYELKIPPNSLLTTNIPAVYPMPENLLFGSIGYTGAADSSLFKTLLGELQQLGLTPAALPDYPYRYWEAGKYQHLSTLTWNQDNYSIYILMNLNNVDARTVFDTVQKSYESTGRKLTIGLFCSNRMEQITGGPVGDLYVYNP